MLIDSNFAATSHLASKGELWLRPVRTAHRDGRKWLTDLTAAIVMSSEIERKFLVRSHEWRRCAEHSERFCQGYIARQKDATVRVRTTGSRAWLTIKGSANGIERPEFEYAIPAADAALMLNTMCHHTLIKKTRHFVRWRQSVWHVDEFGDRYSGLVIAELELRAADQVFDRPDWVGREVTGEAVFQNAALATMSDQEAQTFMRRFHDHPEMAGR